MEVPTPVKVVPKIWGKTRTVSADRNCEVHHATIEPLTRCSRHYHAWKWNLFYVMKGELKVQFFRSEHETQPYQEFTVRPGESFKVPPRQWHRFEAGEQRENVELIEVYWAEEVVANDIVRADEGCRLTNSQSEDPA